MTPDDNLRPYHAKKASGQEAADAVAAVLQHAAARDEAKAKSPRGKGQPKWMVPLGVNLGVFAVYLLIAPPDWVVLNPIDAPPPEEQVADMGTAFFFQASRIDAFKEANGRLPVALADAGSPIEGIAYVVIDPDRYRLSAVVAGDTVTYDSSNPIGDMMSDDAVLQLRGG